MITNRNVKRLDTRAKRERRVASPRQLTPLPPVTAAEACTSSAIKVTGLTDQTGAKWLLIKRGDVSAIVSESALDDPRNSIWPQAAKQGIRITRAPSKQSVLNQIEDLQNWPQTVFVVTRPGFHCGAFVKPDGAVCGEPHSVHFRVVLEGRNVDLGKSGSLQSWQSMVRTFAQGQVAYTTILSAAFAGPLLGLFPSADNVCLWFVGNTSGGKTTGLDLFCSVWGAPHQQPGSVGISLKSTPVGLEQSMMARSGAAFAADDANHLGGNPREQGERVYDLTFMVSHGVEKERCNDPARSRAQLSFLATSNVSLARHLDGQDQSNAVAVLARFLTLPAEAGQFGVFDTIPSGFADAGTGVNGLKDAVAVNYGWAADAFLAKFVDARRTDENALKAKVERYRDSFIKATLVDPKDRPALRRGQSAGMIYAAGRLAREWKVLPLKGLKPLLLEFYHRSVAADAHGASQAALSAQQRVRAYVEANRSKLHDLDIRKPRTMTVKTLDRFPGFLKTVKHHRCLLIRSKWWDRKFGAGSRRLLKELQADGLLLTTDGLQMQIKVRANSKKDRAYCIVLS